MLSPAPLFAQTVGSSASVAAPAVLPDGRSVAGLATPLSAAPRWLRPGQEQAAADLVALMAASRVDGLDPRRYRTKELQRALRAAWGGSPLAAQRAERLLSDAFVDYVRDLRQGPDLGIIYVDPQLRSQALDARAILEGAARQADLVRYVQTMGWMHPYYAPLRNALTDGGHDQQQRALLALNLERVRALPGSEAGRYVLMNAAQQRLFMMERGEVVDMMRVVVGKPVHATPMMAALIRYTSLNPYWNVPPDLVAERVAPFVLKEGIGFLKAKGYQVLSDWGDAPEVVDPRTVDWKAVAAGTREIRVRQLPGPANGMGAMKFMFPNPQGIYLHDTPSTELFSEASRLFSGGCVRLEAAPRLAAWLYNGRAPKAQGAKPEQKVMLDKPVPVYLTYLTAVPSGSSVAFYQDIYGRDASRLAQLGGSAVLASRR
ncbi:L,D-transpeptidase family protein [Sphingomonas sp. GCM10030256]|uniref:L,D-transpeptidase family protein n=1 Tax=Sphingomonas sp. GCM10030256 TaxID=3273427 RepID=UPI003615872A